MILLITEQGAKVSIDAGKVIIKTSTLERLIPKEIIENVSIFGNVELTTSFIRHCLTRDIPISYFSMRGKYFGRTISTSNDNITRLKKQIQIIEDQEFRRNFACITIDAKINNQLTLLRRLNRNGRSIKEKIEEIVRLRAKIKEADTVEKIMGYEVIISRIYYKSISEIFPEEFKFEKRTRRPPRDPFNSMISLGYTILFHEIIGHIESVGLTAYGGIVHGHRRNHPSLASDLIEEFRIPIVDVTVVDLILRGKVKKEDFEITQEGVFLNQKILKTYLEEIQKKLSTTQKYLNYLKEEVTYRRAIYNQAKKLVNAIEQEDAYIYEPLKIRWFYAKRRL